MTERAEMTVSEKRAAHSWVIASNETHSLWERWDGCHSVAGNTGDDAGFTHLRRGWAFYAKGTFTLHRVAGFEWATTDDSWIDEPEEPLPTGHPTPGSTGFEVDVPGTYSVKVRRVVGYCATYAPTDLRRAPSGQVAAEGLSEIEEKVLNLHRKVVAESVDKLRAEIVAALRSFSEGIKPGWANLHTHVDMLADELSKGPK